MNEWISSGNTIFVSSTQKKQNILDTENKCSSCLMLFCSKSNVLMILDPIETLCFNGLDVSVGNWTEEVEVISLISPSDCTSYSLSVLDVSRLCNRSLLFPFSIGRNTLVNVWRRPMSCCGASSCWSCMPGNTSSVTVWRRPGAKNSPAWRPSLFIHPYPVRHFVCTSWTLTFGHHKIKSTQINKINPDFIEPHNST